MPCKWSRQHGHLLCGSERCRTRRSFPTLLLPRKPLAVFRDLKGRDRAGMVAIRTGLMKRKSARSYLQAAEAGLWSLSAAQFVGVVDAGGVRGVLPSGGRRAGVCSSGLGFASPCGTHPERWKSSHSAWYRKRGRVTIRKGVCPSNCVAKKELPIHACGGSITRQSIVIRPRFALSIGREETERTTDLGIGAPSSGGCALPAGHAAWMACPSLQWADRSVRRPPRGPIRRVASRLRWKCSSPPRTKRGR